MIIWMTEGAPYLDRVVLIPLLLKDPNPLDLIGETYRLSSLAVVSKAALSGPNMVQATAHAHTHAHHHDIVDIVQ